MSSGTICPRGATNRGGGGGGVQRREDHSRASHSFARAHALPRGRPHAGARVPDAGEYRKDARRQRSRAIGGLECANAHVYANARGCKTGGSSNPFGLMSCLLGTDHLPTRRRPTCIRLPVRSTLATANGRALIIANRYNTSSDRGS